jgi:hypothetical protein
LQVHAAVGSNPVDGMEKRSVFISSVTRRQVARRRPARHASRLQLTIGVLVIVAAAAAFVLTRGGF